MRANERALLAACIDTGISFGWNKAHKHDDAPHELRIQEEIDNAIWYEIDQYFVFDSERDLCDEVVEGFDHLEKEREWVALTNKDRFWVIDEWQQLEKSVKDIEFNKAIRLSKMIEDKLRELNT